jgi:2-dehydro-3-deoxy-D-arabinonate dehydratase
MSTYLARRADGVIVRERDGRASRLPVDSIAELLRLRRNELEALVARDDLPEAPDAAALPPVDGRTEIWASGVTYLRSRTARMHEATDPDIYDRVYAAERPELFFKSAAWRAVTDAEPIGIRADSSWDVPEPELAVIANAHAEIVGYAICNDVSSRSIEGENPLYLPQAKVYAGACAVGSRIRLATELEGRDLDIRLRILRDGAAIVDETTSTTQLARSVTSLVQWLFRAEVFPDGVWLSTGTGIVPTDDVSLRDGDDVEISIDGLGTLRNPVRRGLDAWATAGAAR